MGTLTPPDAARPDDRRTIDLVRALRRKALDDDLATQASALTFTAFLSLFPLILLATSVLGFRLDNRGLDSIEQLVQTVPGLDQLIQTQARTIVDGRYTAGLVGVVGLLWAASALSNRARRALGIVFDAPEGAIRGRLSALAITIVLGALLVTGLTAAGAISAFLHTHGLSTGWLAAQVGMLALLVLFFLVCYRLLAPGRQRIRDLVPAALVCAVGWTMLQGIGSWFVARQVAHWSALYGAIATVFGVLLFLRIAAWIFLAGAELAETLITEPRRRSWRSLGSTAR
jgi:YihY family inner membrane protein